MVNKNLNINISYTIIIICVAIAINQYFGNIGVYPIDSFFPFNASYEILNNKYPFRDYWTITGPFMDVTQAILFYLFGVNWTIYVLHASIVNAVLGVIVYYFLINFSLSKSYSLVYALLTVSLAYPSSGTPYVDHHASILSIISLLIFIIAIKKGTSSLWYFLPILFFFSFLTKQSPTSYIFLIIGIFYIINLFLYRQYLLTIKIIIETLIIIFILFIIFDYSEIKPIDFYIQYIEYPLSIGENRINDFLFPFDFKRIFLRQKWIHLSLLPLYILFFKKLVNRDFNSNKEFIYFGSIILSSFAFISHQLMTINGYFIFFLIPIYAGFSHCFIKNRIFKKEIFFLLITCVISTYYFNKYIQSRNFMDLKKSDLKYKIEGKLIHEKLKSLKWITYRSEKKPLKEITELNNVIEIIENDKSNKALITDYQFISVILGINDNSPSKVWYNHHVYPTENHRLYGFYKNFFIEALRKEKIEKIFVVKPIVGDQNIVEKIFKNKCYSKKIEADILDVYNIDDCLN
jgi:hypothetical protein